MIDDLVKEVYIGTWQISENDVDNYGIISLGQLRKRFTSLVDIREPYEKNGNLYVDVYKVSGSD